MILEQAFSLMSQWVICMHTAFGILKGVIILVLLVAALLPKTLFSTFSTTRDNCHPILLVDTGRTVINNNS